MPGGGGRVILPLYQAKAEFFKTLGHPARIRVLELLSERERSVGEMLPEVGVEATSLSQQLAVLRRAGLVTFRKEGSTVYYSLTSPQVAELLAVARPHLDWASSALSLVPHVVSLTDRDGVVLSAPAPVSCRKRSPPTPPRSAG